jgi:hypothetical protein
MNTFHCIAPLVALLASGCVSIDRYSPGESWSKRVAARNLKQFEGVYGNQPYSPGTGITETNGTELFGFIGGPAHADARSGDRVEFRFSQDENQLKLRLLDQQNQEIDAATLKRGIDFELSSGRLSLHGPFSGLRSVDNNWGLEFTFEHDRLELSTSGGLLGSSSRNGGMLCMDVIPTFVTKKYWWFWPKITN